MGRKPFTRILLLLIILASMVAVQIAMAADAVVKAYVLPHIPADRADWSCLLVADNLSGHDVTFQLELYGENGDTVYSESVDMPAFGYKEIDLFQSKYPASVSGKLTVPEADDVTFRVVYRNLTDGGTAEFRLTGDHAPILAFNFGTYNDSLTWKGLALSNASGEDTSVQFQAYDDKGSLMGSFNRSLPARSRTAFVLNDSNAFGSGFPWWDCVRVYASSSVGMAGLNISGVNNDKLMFTQAVPAQDLPDGSGGGGSAATGYRIIAWNDLGMHCDDDDFSIFSILPPYNNLWAQVIRMGDKPEIVTNGVVVTYSFEGNTTSVGKTNFWDYVNGLFGVSLPNDIGLTGNGLAGEMKPASDHFIADGIPLTQFNDDMTTDYYQTAIVTARDPSGKILAQTRTVVPISNEMHCSNCHSDGRIEGIATGHYRTNILTLHDQEEGTNLMSSQPVLCASCHSSNALGTVGSQEPLSRVIHRKHADVIPASLDGCYNCHPGPNTACLRGAMFQAGRTCIDCHGDMNAVASSQRRPWLDEPNCGKCHEYGTPDGQLYRLSKGHGGVYCEACHGSTHAILPSALAKDNEQSLLLQGKEGPLAKCSVCHTDGRTGDNPHHASPHPDGWSHDHGDYVEAHGYTSCAQCHGSDYRGGWSGVSCYQCHNGPSGDD